MSEEVDVCAACGAAWKDEKTEHHPLCANARYGWNFTVKRPNEEETPRAHL